jgi:membrane complex biogenesis BtpA family protein
MTAAGWLGAGPLIGMVHVGALPGTPRAAAPVGEIARRAADEARVLADAGFHAVLIENMHDVPYLRRDVGPEIVAAMTVVGHEVRRAVDVPVGVQILAGANAAALAVAHAIGGSFVRAEGFVFAAIADEGLLDEADAGRLLRTRRAIGAGDVRIVADVKKKHSSHAITTDVDLAETARAAAFFGADGVVVTGGATGEATSIDDVRAVRAAVEVPVLVGSGATPETAGGLLKHADALIVGSALKVGGWWGNALDPERVERFVRAVG